MEYFFGYLGLFAFLLIDAGALNRATPKITTFNTALAYISMNFLYILLCAICIFVIVYVGGNLPGLPDNLKIQGDSKELMAFLWGIGIQGILIYLRKFISPNEVSIKTESTV